MASLSTIQPDEKTAPNAIRLISHKYSKLPKKNNVIVCNNFNHLLNNLTYDGHRTNKFMLFHKNIRGLSNKIDEFQITLSSITPQAICLTEHHLIIEQIETVKLDQYTLGASICKQTYKHGGKILNSIQLI